MKIYGYDVIGNKLVINEKEAVIVKKLFEMFTSGASIRSITKYFNDNNIAGKCTKYKIWYDVDISRMLKQEKYIGAALIQKTYREKGKKISNHGEVQQYWVDNNHEAIIDKETFKKAQAILELNSIRYKKENKYTPSPFAKKIKCACGMSYIRKKYKDKWKWRCNRFIRFGRAKCKSINIYDDRLKELFLCAYNESSSFKENYKNYEKELLNIKNNIKILVAQQNELTKLRIKHYISDEDYKQENTNISHKLNKLDKEYKTLLKYEKIHTYDKAKEYDDKLVFELEFINVVENELTFNFKNGAKISKNYN